MNVAVHEFITQTDVTNMFYPRRRALCVSFVTHFDIYIML